jgi:hypothetical protein
MMEIGFDKPAANSFRIQFGIPSGPGALGTLIG